MASKMRELRIAARRAGIADARSMDQDELEAALASSNGSSKKGKAKKAVKAVKAGKAVKRGPGRPKKVREDDEVKPKRGRPKGSKNKVAKVEKPKRGRPAKVKAEEAPKKRGRPAKAASGKAVVKRSGKVGRPKGSGNGTRKLVRSEINWDKNFDFRDGSTSQYILTQLRKSAERYEDTADVRSHAMEKLIPKVGKVDQLVFINRETGKPHKGEKAVDMLKYRVHRTIVDYAMQTGQHGESAKPAKKSKAVKGKAKVATEAPKKRGRPKGSKNAKAKSVKAEKTTKRGPGRPKGSKNKKSKK